MYRFALWVLPLLVPSSGVPQERELPDIRSSELTCVAVLPSITYEVGHQFLDLELVNNCSKDITAYDLRITGAPGTNAGLSREIGHDYLYTLRMKLPPSSKRFEVYDIFRANSRINLRAGELEWGSAAPAEAYLTSAIFSDFTTAGDPKQIEKHMIYRRADLRSLRRIAKALEGVSDLETARRLFRPGSCAQAADPGQTVKADDPLYERLCENVVGFAKICTPESFRKFIIEYKEHIDKGVVIYSDHTERVRSGDATPKENPGEPQR